MNNPAYLKRIKFTGMIAVNKLAPCDVCGRELGAYHIVRDRGGKLADNEIGIGYLYRLRAEGFALAWCICNSELCFNFALISGLSDWYE